jgi:3-dehydroquinate dehydratase-1
MPERYKIPPMPRRAKQFARPQTPPPGGIVGTVHHADSLDAARRLRPRTVDLLELRVDGFPERESALLAAAATLRLPLIVTVRSAAEGGQHPLPNAARAEWYHRFLDVASAIDLELASLPALRAVVEEARRRDVAVILSVHDFAATPSYGRLRSLARRAKASGATIFKCATRLRGPADLYTLHRLVAARDLGIPVAAMGMGPDAPASRLLLGAAGSALNYGYIDRPNAPGQLPAALLKSLLEQLRTAGSSAA